MNYRINDAKVYADITEEDMILLDYTTGIYYSINGFGKEIFNNLNNGAKVETIIEKVKGFQGAPNDIAEKIDSFINSLLNYELMIKASDTDLAVEIDENIVKSDSFEIVLNRYDDAQEMLLADPIHEVKEDEGWTPDKSSLNEDLDDVRRRESKYEG